MEDSEDGGKLQADFSLSVRCPAANAAAAEIFHEDSRRIFWTDPLSCWVSLSIVVKMAAAIHSSTPT
jgi:hypothetical protein